MFVNHETSRSETTQKRSEKQNEAFSTSQEGT